VQVVDGSETLTLPTLIADALLGIGLGTRRVRTRRMIDS
jgi:hypothetical protein